MILALLDDAPISPSLDTIHAALILTGHGWSPVFDKNIWSELLSTGKLSLLLDGNLRNKIGECYSLMEHLTKFDEEWSTWNVRFRQNTGHALPADLRIAISESVGHYKLLGEINHPLLNQNELKRRLQPIEGMNALVSDVIMVRRVGALMLKDLLEMIDAIIDDLDTSLFNSTHQ